MSTFNFFGGKPNLVFNPKLNFRDENAVNICLYEPKHSAAIPLLVLPVSVLSPSCEDPAWQLMILREQNGPGDDMKRVCVTTNKEASAQIDGHRMKTIPTEIHDARIKKDASVYMYDHGPLRHSNPASIFNPGPSTLGASASDLFPPIPQFDIDLGSQYAQIMCQPNKNDKEFKARSGEVLRTRANEESGRFVGFAATSEGTSESKEKCATKLSHRNASDDGNGIKRHTCMYCQKELFNSTGLKHHIYTHTNAWPFRCCWPGCTKGTATKRDLMKHQRTHTGERPFVCNICNKKFTQSGVMHRHKKACAKKKMTKCLETALFCRSNNEDNKKEMGGSWLVKSFNNSNDLPDTFSSPK